jgi:alkylhydroperoxidase family enzyme
VSSWIGAEAEGVTPLERVLGLCPALSAAYRDFAGRFWTGEPLDPVLLELCRLRIAQILGCQSELSVRHQVALDAGLDEGKVAALASWPSDDRFGPLERACLNLAEQFVLDPNLITDEDAAAVSGSIGEPGLVALTEALALFDGFCRLQMVLAIDQPSASPVVVDASEIPVS